MWPISSFHCLGLGVELNGSFFFLKKNIISHFRLYVLGCQITLFHVCQHCATLRNWCPWLFARESPMSRSLNIHHFNWCTLGHRLAVSRDPSVWISLCTYTSLYFRIGKTSEAVTEIVVFLRLVEPHQQPQRAYVFFFLFIYKNISEKRTSSAALPGSVSLAVPLILDVFPWQGKWGSWWCRQERTWRWRCLAMGSNSTPLWSRRHRTVKPRQLPGFIYADGKRRFKFVPDCFHMLELFWVILCYFCSRKAAVGFKPES